jgi:hypothetical protein
MMLSPQEREAKKVDSLIFRIESYPRLRVEVTEQGYMVMRDSVAVALPSNLRELGLFADGLRVGVEMS